MPEGPEIILLQEAATPFVGERVLHAEGHSQHVPLAGLAGQVLRSVRSHGKELFFCFDSTVVRVHLCLFGKWVLDGALPRKLGMELVFAGGALRFYHCDCRQVAPGAESMQLRMPDVFDSRFDTGAAALLLAKRPGQLVCDALLDQQLFPGVGNGIKNEVLYRCGVHPLSETGAVPPRMLQKLADACVAQSHAYLEHLRENTLAAYWQVYRKKSCLRDGLPLRAEKLGKGKRSCYYCERCQEWFAPGI